MGRRGDEFIIILDLNAVFTSSDAVLVPDGAAALAEAALPPA
jgi:purine-binding chemotaxis protein CheW